MTTSKKAITAAKKLLEKEGFTVSKKRPDPMIGDIVKFAEDNSIVLITFHQTDDVIPNGVWDFGGVVVSRATYRELYTDSLWIDRNEWAKDDGQYTVIGHVDLSKAMK